MSEQESRLLRWRPALASAALVLISIIVTGIVIFVIGEAFFRVKYRETGSVSSQSWYEYEQKRGWRLRPGAYSYLNFGSDRVVDVVINEWGLRDQPLTAEVPAGKTRISIVGDSFVFSEALNTGNRFTEKLQALAGPEYEIVNVSVPGYGTGQQFRMLEDLRSRNFQLGAKVILVFFTNDIQDNLGIRYSSLKDDPIKPKFSVDAQGNLIQDYPKKKREARTQRNILNRSLFFNFLKRRAELVAAKYPVTLRILDAVGLAPDVPRTPGVIAGWYGPGWQERWAVTRDVLAYVAKEFKTQFAGTELLIAYVPSPVQVEEVFKVMISQNLDEDPRYKEFFDDIERPQNLVREFCEQQGIPFIDLSPALAEVPGAYFAAEGHLSEAGSEITARVLFENAISGK